MRTPRSDSLLQLQQAAAQSLLGGDPECEILLRSQCALEPCCTSVRCAESVGTVGGGLKLVAQAGSQLGAQDAQEPARSLHGFVAALGVGGTVGALLTGVFAEKAVIGLFDGAIAGNPMQVVIQGVAVLTAIVYSGGMSFVLLKLVGAVIPLRATADDESMGLDISEHGEEAYLHTGGASPAVAMSSMPVGVQPTLSPINGDV